MEEKLAANVRHWAPKSPVRSPKPEILIQELKTVGYHQGDVGRTRSRLDKGKAWKRQRIVVLVPAGQDIPVKVYLSHISLVYPPNNGVARMVTRDMEVGEAYSTSIDEILRHPELSNWEYLLTMEHDNMPQPDAVLRLVERMEANPRFACISGAYYTKGEGGVLQAWGDPKDTVTNFRPLPPDPNGGLVECCGLGMGFALWRLKVFKDTRLRRPWFVTQTKSGVATQDLYFWNDARKFGHRCAVDCSVKVGHYDKERDFVW